MELCAINSVACVVAALHLVLSVTDIQYCQLWVATESFCNSVLASETHSLTMRSMHRFAIMFPLVRSENLDHVLCDEQTRRALHHLCNTGSCHTLRI